MFKGGKHATLFRQESYAVFRQESYVVCRAGTLRRVQAGTPDYGMSLPRQGRGNPPDGEVEQHSIGSSASCLPEDSQWGSIP